MVAEGEASAAPVTEEEEEEATEQQQQQRRALLLLGQRIPISSYRSQQSFSTVPPRMNVRPYV